jgi:two-component sensor histidine kinase
MELEAMGAEIGTRVAIGGPAVVLPNTVVQTLALVLHELATNARKYGALFVPAGQLRVSWSLADNHAGTPRLLLEWREDELEPVREASSPTTSGYGRELIEHALPYSLGAKTSYTLAGTSLLCTIEVPLRRRTGLGRSHG